MGWVGSGLDGVLVEAGLCLPQSLPKPSVAVPPHLTHTIETIKNQSMAVMLTVSDLCEWVCEYLP